MFTGPTCEDEKGKTMGHYLIIANDTKKQFIYGGNLRSDDLKDTYGDNPALSFLEMHLWSGDTLRIDNDANPNFDVPKEYVDMSEAFEDAWNPPSERETKSNEPQEIPEEEKEMNMHATICGAPTKSGKSCNNGRGTCQYHQGFATSEHFNVDSKTAARKVLLHGLRDFKIIVRWSEGEATEDSSEWMAELNNMKNKELRPLFDIWQHKARNLRVTGMFMGSLAPTVDTTEKEATVNNDTEPKTEKKGPAKCPGDNNTCKRTAWKETGKCSLHGPTPERKTEQKDSTIAEVMEEKGMVNDNSVVFQLFGVSLAFVVAAIRKNGNKFRLGGGGSRRLKLANVDEKNRVARLLIDLFTELKDALGDDLTIVSGMAEGFDELLALVAKKLGIRLVVSIPNKGYLAYYWTKNSVTKTDRTEDYKAILDYAVKVFYVKEDVLGITQSGVYLNEDEKTASWKAVRGTKHANYIRNTHMVQLCDAMVFYGQTDGGTADCYGKARRAGIMTGVIKP